MPFEWVSLKVRDKKTDKNAVKKWILGLFITLKI